MAQRLFKSIILFQIILIFIVPIFLIYFDIISKDARLFVLCLSCLFIYGIIRREKWSYQKMGIRLFNYKEVVLPYILFTLAGLLFLFIIAQLFNMHTQGTLQNVYYKFLFFIPISFFQEFAYRAFLLRKLEKVFRNKTLIIITNAFLFMLLHIIYPHSFLVLPMTFIGGIAFAMIYLKYPNLVLIGVSHSILNISAILLGFFRI